MPHLLAAVPPPVVSTWPTWVIWILGVGAVATALLAIVAAAIKLGVGMKTLANWLGDIVTDRVYGDDRAMTAERVRAIVEDYTLSAADITEIVNAKVAPIIAQVHPNGGESIKDQVTELARVLDEHIEASAEDRTELRDWAEELRSRMLFPDERTSSDDTRGS